MLASLNTAAGFADNADEQRLAGSIMSKVPPGVRPVSMGVFPGRGRGFRVSMNGFAHGTVLRKFLRSIGWSGRYDVLEEVIAGLAQGRAAPNLGVMLYCRGDTMECRLGIGSRPLRPDDLPAVLENLRGLGCIKTKLSGVRAMVRAPVALWGKGGEFTLLSKFSHVKVVVSQTGIEQIKAYAGFVFA